MDRLRAYEVFVTVIAKGSFTRAADALDTSPANVTRYVNELEAHLGTRLINRSSRRLSLTESGQALYDRAGQFLEDIGEAETIIGQGSLRPAGRLRINAPLSFGIAYLSPLWPQFMAKYPEIELDISLADRVVDLVEEGYDMAIRISRAGSGSYVSRKLAVSRNVVCASPDYIARYGAPEMPEDLANHACIINQHSPTPDAWHLLDANGREHIARPGAVMRVNNGETARAAMLAGTGINWQAMFVVGDDLRAGRLIRLLPDYHMPDIDIQALYPSRRHLSAKVRVMVDFLSAAFRGTPPWELG
jgi:DNA-binding transcriptional LysR family regulator